MSVYVVYETFDYDDGFQIHYVCKSKKNAWRKICELTADLLFDISTTIQKTSEYDHMTIKLSGGWISNFYMREFPVGNEI